MTTCLWCNRAFPPRATGGSAQRFCSPGHRHEFHKAARRWAEEAVADGRLSARELRRGYRNTTDGENRIAASVHAAADTSGA